MTTATYDQSEEIGPSGEAAKDRTLCILNPAAGLLRHSGLRASLTRMMRGMGAEVVETDGLGRAEQLAAEARGFTLLIACGGDGTVLEIVNGMDLGRQRLAVIPAGRGNSVAHDLGVARMRAALEALRRFNARRIDLISWEIESNGDTTPRRGRAVNALGFGLLAEVVRRAHRTPRLGSLGYAVSGLLAGSDPRAYEISVRGGGVRLARLAGVVAGNTRHFARFVPSSASSPDDARLDLMFLPADVLREKMLAIGTVCGAGAIGTSIERILEVDIRPRSPSPLYVDGEVIGGVARLRASCLPGALTCIAAEPER